MQGNKKVMWIRYCLQARRSAIYLYSLFKKLTPIQFHQGALANYEIRV